MTAKSRSCTIDFGTLAAEAEKGSGLELVDVSPPCVQRRGEGGVGRPMAEGEGAALLYWWSQDGEQQLMVATELTSNASDPGAMMGRFDEVKETFDAQPETVLADAGYCNERDLSELEARGIDGYVAPGREGKRVVASNGP